MMLTSRIILPKILAFGISGIATRRIAGCADENLTAHPKITLYQYKICPFCSRVKSYLDFLKLDYTTVEVNPFLKSEISFSKEYRKVPIATVGDSTVTGSDSIIKALSSLKKPKDSFFPHDNDYWMEWSEKKLAVLLYPNITRTLQESWECFSYTSDVDSWNYPKKFTTRILGSIFMTIANRSIRKKYGIVDERKELNALLLEWTTALQNRKFLHGDHMTMPDLMVFGVLKSIEDFKTFREIMDGNHLLSEWYHRMNVVIHVDHQT